MLFSPEKLAAAALVVSVLLLSLIAAGCFSSSSDLPKSDAPASPALGSGGPSSAPPSPSGAVSAANSVLLAENKTGAEKTQATIAALVPDGTYESNVTYYYHAGPETVDIQITLKGDVVTAVSVSGINPMPMSARIINSFNAALPGLVVGKKIDQLGLPRNVAGSSLTNAAFQQYVADLVQSHERPTSG
ncbi:MAG: hypothetical protein V1728_02050 [Candidatus Micrarchaeota archaeon]